MKQEIMKAPASPKAKKKVEKVMGEFKRGKLKSGSGQKVKGRDQAIAIALSEARGAMQRKYGGKGVTMYKDSATRRFGDAMEDPRKPGAGMRNAGRFIMEGDRGPKYTEKEKAAMQAVKDERKTKQMREAYERAMKRGY